MGRQRQRRENRWIYVSYISLEVPTFTLVAAVRWEFKRGSRLRGLSFLLSPPLIYSGAQLFPSIDAIKNKSRPEDRVSASPIWGYSLFIWSFSFISLFFSTVIFSYRPTLNKKYITLRILSWNFRTSHDYSASYVTDKLSAWTFYMDVVPSLSYIVGFSVLI